MSNIRSRTRSTGRRFIEFARLAVALFSITFLCVGCDIQPRGEGPGKRPQVLALAPQQELEIGRQAFGEIRKKAKTIDDGPEIELVRRVSKRIAKAVEIKPLQREINLHIADYNFEWDYAVFENDSINAFCLPGGKIVVFSGLIQFVENEDQLATVIAHEVAHALAHHTSERIARERTVGNGILSLAFNREQELEADHIGVFLMAFAGYDPDQALHLWRGMLTAHASRIHLPEIISDHPTDAHRLTQLQTWVETAKAAKAAYDAGRVVKP